MEVKQNKENGINKKESKYTIEKIKLFLWKDDIIYKHIISPIKGRKKKRHNSVSNEKFKTNNMDITDKEYTIVLTIN